VRRESAHQYVLLLILCPRFRSTELSTMAIPALRRTKKGDTSFASRWVVTDRARSLLVGRQETWGEGEEEGTSRAVRALKCQSAEKENLETGVPDAKHGEGIEGGYTERAGKMLGYGCWRCVSLCGGWLSVWVCV
jgi:hypothetical protein